MSSFGALPGDAPRERKPEVRETPHETESEFGALAGDAPRERKPEVRETVHEAKSEPGADFAEKSGTPDPEAFAWALLEGLRRAARAR